MIQSVPKRKQECITMSRQMAGKMGIGKRNHGNLQGARLRIKKVRASRQGQTNPELASDLDQIAMLIEKAIDRHCKDVVQ